VPLLRIYEAASRWRLQQPYLEDYKRMARMDIRGYYFLNKETDLKDKLTHWSSLDDATQKKYSEWLINECNEYRLNNWSLQIDYSKRSNLAHVVFKPGITAHCT
jgi:hypothetical protein